MEISASEAVKIAILQGTEATNPIPFLLPVSECKAEEGCTRNTSVKNVNFEPPDFIKNGRNSSKLCYIR